MYIVSLLSPKLSVKPATRCYVNRGNKTFFFSVPSFFLSQSKTRIRFHWLGGIALFCFAPILSASSSSPPKSKTPSWAWSWNCNWQVASYFRTYGLWEQDWLEHRWNRALNWRSQGQEYVFKWKHRDYQSATKIKHWQLSDGSKWKKRTWRGRPWSLKKKSIATLYSRNRILWLPHCDKNWILWLFVNLNLGFW